MSKEQKLTANQFTNVRDIKGNFLETKNGYLMCYIKVDKIPTDLMKTSEKRAKASSLAASHQTDRKDFVYVSYPREIDLDDHKQEVRELYSKEKNKGRRNLLEIAGEHYNFLSTSGENFEHQHFIKIWQYIGNTELREVKVSLMQRARGFVDRYNAIGVPTKILNSGDIIKMCNLYGNSPQAPFEVPVNSFYEGMTIFRDEIE